MVDMLGYCKLFRYGYLLTVILSLMRLARDGLLLTLLLSLLGFRGVLLSTFSPSSSSFFLPFSTSEEDGVGRMNPVFFFRGVLLSCRQMLYNNLKTLSILDYPEDTVSYSESSSVGLNGSATFVC